MVGELTLKQAIEEYKDVYLAYRNYAQRTRVEYTNDLGDLFEYLGRVGIVYVKDVKLSNLVRYMAELDRRGLLGSTRKRKVISIKSFFSFMFSESYTTTNVARELIPPFVEESRPRYLTEAENNRLRNACAGNVRDAAIVELLLQTGIRLSELTSLLLDDVELQDDGGSIRIRGTRGRKERMLPLNSKACVPDFKCLSKSTI
jgi:site-specific recombinase XerD